MSLHSTRPYTRKYVTMTTVLGIKFRSLYDVAEP